MSATTYTAVVLNEPFGRLVRFLPPLQVEFQRLADLHLFVLDPKSKRMRMTLRGQVAHWVACEMNPRRASYRSVTGLTQYMKHHSVYAKESLDSAIEFLIQNNILKWDASYRDGVTALCLKGLGESA